jgi:hypothetical protein
LLQAAAYAVTQGIVDTGEWLVQHKYGSRAKKYSRQRDAPGFAARQYVAATAQPGIQLGWLIGKAVAHLNQIQHLP